MVTFSPFSKGLFVSFLSASYITSHATKCYLFSASGNIFKWHTSLLFKHFQLKCYFVTLLPRPFCNNTKGAERIVEVWKINRISNQTPKQFVKKWHMMTMTITITITIGMRPLFPLILHSILQIAMQMRWPTATYVQVLTVKCKMQWILVFWEYNMVLLI